MTWFSSPVWAQGLRRDKEYARLGDNLRHCSWKWTTLWYAWYRWLPAAWLDLNEALPKCRNWKCEWSKLQVPVKSTPPGPPLLFFRPFSLSRGSSWEKSINSGVLQMIVLEWICMYTGFSCFTYRNGQQKQNCESLKRTWRNFAHLTRPPCQSVARRPTGIHCWIAPRHKWITCIFSTGDSAGPFPCVKTNQRKWWMSCFWIGFLGQFCQTAKG